MLRPRSFGVWSATMSVIAPPASNVTSTWTLPHRFLETPPSTPVAAARAGVVGAFVGVFVVAAAVVGAFVACAADSAAVVAGAAAAAVAGVGVVGVVGATVPVDPDVPLVRTIAPDPAASEPAPAVLPNANKATRPAVVATLS